MHIILNSILIVLILILIIRGMRKHTHKKWSKSDLVLNSFITILTVSIILFVFNLFVSLSDDIVPVKAEQYTLAPLNVVSITNVNQYAIINPDSIMISYLDKDGKKADKTLPKRHTKLKNAYDPLFVINEPAFKSVFLRFLLGKPFIMGDIDKDFTYYEVCIPKDCIQYNL